MNQSKELITDPVVAANQYTKYLGILGMLWVTFLLITVFTAVKTFSIGPFVLNIAILAYPFTYVFADILERTLKQKMEIFQRLIDITKEK